MSNIRKSIILLLLLINTINVIYSKTSDTLDNEMVSEKRTETNTNDSVNFDSKEATNNNVKEQSFSQKLKAENQTTDGNNLFFIFMIGFVSIVFSMALGLLIMYLYILIKIRDIINNGNDRYEQEFNIKSFLTPIWCHFQEFKDKKEYYKRKHKDVQNQLRDQELKFNAIINNLDIENKNLRKDYEDLKFGKKSQASQMNETDCAILSVPVQEISPNKSSLFFSIPEINGSFIADKAKSNKEKETYYRIEQTNESNGILYFIPGDYDQRAINNINYYLNPACNIENFSQRINAQKIEILSPGSVTLSGNIWTINQKVKLKLI